MENENSGESSGEALAHDHPVSARTSLIGSTLRLSLGMEQKENPPATETEPVEQIVTSSVRAKETTTRSIGFQVFSFKTWDEWKKHYEDHLKPWRTVSYGDAEGKGAFATFGDRDVFVHAAIPPPDEPRFPRDIYYLNNAASRECYDFEQQFKPLIERVDEMDKDGKVVGVNMKMYDDTRIFMDIKTNAMHKYGADPRGDGQYQEHIVVKCCLGSKMVFSAQVGLFRMVCMNGMIRFADVQTYTKRKTSGFLDNHDLNLPNTDIYWDFFNKLQQTIIVPGTIGQLISSLPKRWQEIILREIKKESGGANIASEKVAAWCLYNALTYVTSHTDEVSRDGEEVSEATIATKMTDINKIMSAVMGQKLVALA